MAELDRCECGSLKSRKAEYCPICSRRNKWENLLQNRTELINFILPFFTPDSFTPRRLRELQVFPFPLPQAEEVYEKIRNSTDENMLNSYVELRSKDSASDVRSSTYSVSNFTDRGVFLQGRTGGGKTTLVYQLAILFLRDRYIEGALNLQDICFYNMVDLLSKIKETYGGKGISTSSFLEQIVNKPLLILDDVGVEKGTVTEMLNYYQLINVRFENMLPTYYTSNYTMKQLRQKGMDDRLLSRMKRTSLQVEYHYADY